MSVDNVDDAYMQTAIPLCKNFKLFSDNYNNLNLNAKK